MVRIDFSTLGVSWEDMKSRLDGAGIKLNRPIANSLRIVTHRDVDAADAERLLGTLP